MARKQTVIKLFLVVLIAVLIGFMHGIPHLIIPNLLSTQGQQYTPFSLDTKNAQSAFEEMYAYAPQVQAVLRGQVDSFVRTPFFGEIFPSFAYALLARIFGSVPAAFVVADFIFPTLTFLCLFWLIFRGTKKFSLSIFMAVAVVVVWNVAYYLPRPNLTWDFLWDFRSSGFLELSRGFHPQFSFLVLISASTLLHECLISNGRKRIVFAVLAIIAGGLLFYTYAFYWMFWVSTIFMVALYSFLNENKSSFITTFVVILGTVMVGLPYFYNSFLFSQTPEAADFLSKTTIPVKNLFPDFTIKYLLFALIFYFWPRKKNALDVIIFSSLVASALLPLATQVGLGRDLEKFHFIRRAFFPFSVVAMGIMLGSLKIRWGKILFSGLTGGLLFLGFVHQIVPAKLYSQSFVLAPEKQALFSWLSENTKPGSSIAMINLMDSLEFPSSTHLSLFVPSVDRTTITSQSVAERYFCLLKLLGVPADTVNSWFKTGSNNRLLTHLYYFSHSDRADMKNTFTSNYIAFSNQGCLSPDYVLIDFAKDSGDTVKTAGNSHKIVYNYGGHMVLSIKQ